MVAALASILVLALTRAEIIERMKAPVLTQCEGLVQVYADCPEDMRREFQMPIASFASDTVKALYRGVDGGRMRRFEKAGIVVHVGDVRTNDTSVVARVSTNGTRIVSRIYIAAPGHADVRRFKLEVIKAFCRILKGQELDDDGAIDAYRAVDPRFRIEDERLELERWLAGEPGHHDRRDAEHYLRLMRKVIEPGVASRRDILVFASRLYLYAPLLSEPFVGQADSLTFREAVKYAPIDPRIRLAAYRKAGEIMAFGGGRGETLAAASTLYSGFLLELARGEMKPKDLLTLLDEADVKLNVAFEEALKRN